MEARQKRPRFLLSTIFHILHVCISIGLVIAVVRNQLVNEARFERLEKNDCKCPTDKTQRKDAASESLDSITDQDITLPHDVTSVHSVAKRASDEQLASGFKEEQNITTVSAEPFLTNQSTSTSNTMKTGSVNYTRPIPGATTGATESLNQEKQLNSSGPKMSEENRILISCFNELKFFIENQVEPSEVDDNMSKRCQPLRGPKGESGEKGQRGEKGAIGPKGCSGTSFAYPFFKSSPRHLVINEGDPVVLSCNATASPSAQITWYRDDKRLFPKRNVTGRYVIKNRNIQFDKASVGSPMCPSEIPHPATQSSLVIKKSRGSDTGTYFCKAHNMMGVVSHEIQVLVREYVKCSVFPSSTTVVQGNDVQLSCRAYGVPTPVITWYRKDGGPMPRLYNITEGNLHIYEISKDEEGTFVCLATNVLGSKKTEAAITVNVLPKITLFPEQPITINESHTLVLQCKATGYPNPEIQWSKVNDPLPEGRYAYDSQMLNISRVNYEDRGAYICTANNTVGSSVKKITVTVQVGPKITKRQSATEYGYRRKSKTLLLEVFAHPEAKVTWKKPNKEKVINQGRFQQRNSSLIIENIKYTDSGRYEVTARNILGEVKVTTFLVVRDAVPALILSKEFRKTITVKEGRNLTAMCHAVGVPTPQMVWTHKNKTIISEKSLTLSLDIVNVGSQNAGSYNCTVTNQFGSDQQTLDVTIIERWVTVEGWRRRYNWQNYNSFTTTSRSTGRVYSYNYPSNYPNQFTYNWKLTSNAKISLYFTNFDTESCCDKLRIYDGRSISSPLLGEFSGNTLPPNITSSSSALYLQFASDNSKQRPGFLANYKAVD